MFCKRDWVARQQGVQHPKCVAKCPYMLPWRLGGHRMLLWRLLDCPLSHSALGGGLWVAPQSSIHIGQTGLEAANLGEAVRRSWGRENTQPHKEQEYITIWVWNCDKKYSILLKNLLEMEMFGVMLISMSLIMNYCICPVFQARTADNPISDVERTF